MRTTRTHNGVYKLVAAASALLIAVSLGIVAGAQPASAAANTTNVTVSLTDSSGAPLSGAAISYYGKAVGSTVSKWHTMDSTGSSGTAIQEITSGKVTFQLTYKHTRESKAVTLSGASQQVDFQTVPATVKLQDSAGNPIQGASAAYYGTATAWQSMGTTGPDGTVTSEVLPSAISFSVAYNGGREQLDKVAVGNSGTTIDYQTKSVTVKLNDQVDNPLAGGSFSRYGLAPDGWIKDGTTGPDGAIELELLNGSYTIKVTHNKKSQSTKLVVGGASTGHTFVTEVEQPVVPETGSDAGDKDEVTNEGESNEGGTDEGDENGTDEGETNEGESNEGETNEGGTDEGESNDGDAKLPDPAVTPEEEDDVVPPVIDTDVNQFPAVKPGSEEPEVQLHEDSLASQAPTDDPENSEEAVTVEAESANDEGADILAKTGSDATVAGGLGALMLLIGFGLVGASRRNRQTN